jgi:hypothetical protein
LVNTIIKNPDKKHKLQYMNQRDELSYIEGRLIHKNSDAFLKHASLSDFNITYYNASSKQVVRQILIINLPQHNGLTNDFNTSDNDGASYKSIRRDNTSAVSTRTSSRRRSSKQSADKKTSSREKKTSSRDAATRFTPSTRPKYNSRKK